MAKQRLKLNQVRISPVDSRRMELPKGDGNWPGFDHVYSKLQEAAHRIAEDPRLLCSSEHIEIMAILGCGHEETMKAELARCYSRGWI